MLKHSWQAARTVLFRRRHTTLLLTIIAAFGVRPLIGDSVRAQILFSLSMLVVLLVALYTIQVDELLGDRERLRTQRQRWSRVGWILAMPAVVTRLAMMYAPGPRLGLAASITWLIFFAFVTWTELRSVLRQREITSETIAMSISVYLLLGLTFGLLYSTIYEFQPKAFSLGAIPPGELFATFVYFSLTTLSTVGFGDIVPQTLEARYAAVAEAITGQFYLAILVARLVGMQMAQTSGPPADRRSSDRESEPPSPPDV